METWAEWRSQEPCTMVRLARPRLQGWLYPAPVTSCRLDSARQPSMVTPSQGEEAGSASNTTSTRYARVVARLTIFLKF